MPVQTAHDGELALADLLDRALNKGVVLWGDATISLAGVELVYVGLRVLVASCSTMEKYRSSPRKGSMPIARGES
ncbi:Gas vesicle protein [Enhydrobacter aerosaccus]|uniref:Gas vesicle protein n=1 Tax=Enhydrobacter aerosaccus TaxID=225324 RepID=A0A1T4LV69_9HYPH|nr:gas vesicle protein [Enhydrobacter aerosaccus]SJZ58575.1 Gas vesicle protein [Enhydrobacter aerosaccus]